MKANPWSLVQAHYATLVDARNGRARIQDHIVFEGVPLVVFAASLIFGLSLPKGASVGLLTVAGILGAFLFGVMLQIAERAMFWADAKPAQGADTSRQAIFLEQIAANAGYATLVSVLTAAVFVVASVTEGAVLTIASALGLALVAHLLLVLLMVMTRVFSLIQQRLLDSRTGATVTPMPQRKVG